MHLQPIDVAIIISYLVAMVVIGIVVTRRASRSLDSYFLAGHSMPWYVLGISDASAMFDLTGTMWLVYNLFVYGMKGAWLPWLWPTFNQVFMMVFLSRWIRRSNVLTGAEWMATRFGHGRGAELCRIVIVVFALVSVTAFLAYSFQGMGKFAKVFLPWDLSPNTYALIIMCITATYVIMGGMISVVLTDVSQFLILTISCFVITYIAMTRVSPEMVAAMVPAGWGDLFFGWRLDLDWSQLIPVLNQNISKDGYSFFGLFFSGMVAKGILVSLAGPAPNFDMQRVLAVRSPREASLMNGIVSFCLMPRWLMVGSMTVIGIVFLSPQFRASTGPIDFEMILPYVINNFLPAGLVGFLLAGLLAAFMANLSATINAGAAYLTNDLYKRYLKKGASERHYVMAGYLSPVLILAVGMSVGLALSSINQITQWIVSGLYGGFTAANLLKWYWHRLNGFGYFWGMVAGIGSALVMPLVAPDLHPLWGFPFIFVLSFLASVAGSLWTAPEEEGVVEAFYRQVRPWGLWGPVVARLQQADPSFQPNQEFGRDMLNVAIAVPCQFTLVTMPLYLVLRNWTGLLLSAVIFLATAAVLKRTWYQRLEA
jgi:SSS family solute:Na+ symporter